MATTPVWTSSAAIDGYILLTGNIQSALISGVKACSATDVDQYDLTNYRDTFVSQYDGGYITHQEQLTTGSPYIEKVKVNEPTTPSTESDIASISASVSGSDELMHVPPRPELRKRTMLLFWSGTIDTSNVLASCWADEYRSFSKGIYTFAA